MKSLQIQIHPDLRPEWDAGRVLSAFRLLAKNAAFPVKLRVAKKNGRRAFINARFLTTDLKQLWSLLQKEFRKEADLRATSITVCEGNNGWSDYLLLHHYDAAEPLDRLGRGSRRSVPV